MYRGSLTRLSPEILQELEQIDQQGKPIPGQKAYKPNAQPKIVFIVVGKRSVQSVYASFHSF